MTRLSLIILCSLLGNPWSVFAQDATTGTIRGVVEDTSATRYPIDGVRVVIIDPEGTEYETVTDDQGDYVITGLSPGHYLLNLYKDGYETRKDQPVKAIAGGDYYVPVRMAKKEPPGLISPWLLFICFGGVVLIVGLVVAVASRNDSPSD